ncbi:hypothetical protein [Methanoculleus receptaculi]|uniref:Uncharacterized protein n=1 Tax=Methanoculleus receptaculi TaxID=394967 RepID=A0AAX4FSG4_9EURY|nr:hypothetical protein [Methanoculleus receptaculi]WOX56873.1 hypothetical protein R6Y96_05995 [Methanoculleus receptaculi]
MMMGGCAGSAHDQDGIIASNISRTRTASMIVTPTRMRTPCVSETPLSLAEVRREGPAALRGGRVLLIHSVDPGKALAASAVVVVQVSALAAHPVSLGGIGTLVLDLPKGFSFRYDKDLRI